MDLTNKSETTSALSTSPNPTCLYQTAHIRHALAKIRRAIARKQGLCCIFGDIGLGKSSLLRFLFAEYASDDNFQVAFLPSGDLPSSYAFTKRIAVSSGCAVRTTPEHRNPVPNAPTVPECNSSLA